MKKVLDVFKRLVEIFKKPLWLLCLGLGIVLFASIFANMANTSLYSVSVTEVEFETTKADGEEKGVLHALVYRPRKCTAEKPCATIITTHGYLNTKEMQDAPSVEMSRRGYVVVALDMYQHGDSYYTDTTQSFWGFTSSMWDAVKEVYDWDFVMKANDARRTGMIAVSGHSMGASAALSAVNSDYNNYKNSSTEPQRIAAVLAVANTGGTIESRVQGQVTSGTIAAHYDEFFFNPDNYNSSTATGYPRKDWVKTAAGAQFYYGDSSATATDEIEAGVWNDAAYGGAGSVI